MVNAAEHPNSIMTRRRDFLKSSAAVLASGMGLPKATEAQQKFSREAFQKFQEKRRDELWSLLGNLPWSHKPRPPRVVKVERYPGYRLERLELDLNGLEPVPALLLIPDRRQTPAPGLLFIHWHAGQYDLGKEQLIKGTRVQPAYAPVCAKKGLVTLAIDSWCFGERKHEPDGRTGEENTFKLMLWRGRVLWGMMMFDEFRAFDYLASRPEVDPQHLGTFGMSMGSTKAWWLAALESRVCLCIGLCCLTDYQSLIQEHGLSGHSIYYYVPSLLEHFQTAQINELIVPRAHLSLNGRKDPLTPPAGVEKIANDLAPLYKEFGRSKDCRIELFDCAHQELPAMRKLVMEWMDLHLTIPGAAFRAHHNI